VAIKDLSLKWKITVPAALMVGVAVLAIALFIISKSRDTLIQEAEIKTMSGYKDTVLNSLTTMMVHGNIQDSKKDFLDQMSSSADIRVLRSETLNRDYPSNDTNGHAQNDTERSVLSTGSPHVEMVGDRLVGVYPYIAGSKVMGKNCLTCHQVPEGTVLGTISISLPMSDSLARISQLKKIAIAAAVIAAMCIAGLLAGLIGLALKPIAIIKKGVETIVAGDLTAKLTIECNDEIGTMAESFNHVAGAFSNMVDHMVVSTDKVVTISDLLKKSAESTVAKTSDQTEQSQQIAVAAEEMSQTIADIAKNTASAAEVSGDALFVAKEGQVTTDHAIAQIAQIQQSTSDLAAVIKEVNTEAEQIGGILTVIDEIADQTNLLALNAAIEAARAGNAGRGFAVVADEVRKLAEKTSSATDEIMKKITAMRNSTTQAEKAMLSTREKVDQGTSLVQQAGNALTRIVSSVEHVKDQITQIAAAVEEQSATAEEISENVSRTSVATAEVQKLADEVMSDVDKMVETAEQLMDATMSIKTSGNPDNVFVDKAIATAAAISAIMQKTVDSNGLGIGDLFDETYVEIKGTNPQQYNTKSMSFLEKVLPEIQEAVLKFNSRAVFCVAVDRNAFLPVHNAVYSKAQRRAASAEDIAWNTANCRNKRFFKDRVGYAAAQNEKEVLLRVYRREMGGGQFVQMKDVSAPIYVSGKHWGGLRIGYKVEEPLGVSNIKNGHIAEVHSINSIRKANKRAA